MLHPFTTNVDIARYAQINHLPLVGVFSRDTLPAILRNGGYVINLDDRTGEGTHWTLLMIDGAEALYIDPFGQPPPAEIERRLKKQYRWNYNKKIIQNPKSGYCGLYAVLALWYITTLKKKYKKLSTRLKKYQALWSSDVDKNLTILKYLYRAN